MVDFDSTIRQEYPRMVSRKDDPEFCPPGAGPPSQEEFPSYLLADDATAADQAALSLLKATSKKIITTDATSLVQGTLSPDEGAIWVVNSGTRALSSGDARLRNQRIAGRLRKEGDGLPIFQIDSRLRGIGNALRGVFDALSFEVLLFVPAEPELGRFVQAGAFYHLENGELTPFHRSALAQSADYPLDSSCLRSFVAGELEIAQDRVLSIEGEVVSRGPDAVVEVVHRLRKQGKSVVIPDVRSPEDFECVTRATKRLGREGTLLAGSRTFLRGLFASFQSSAIGVTQPLLLSESIDWQKRGAPLAIVCSLEGAMNSQVEYARQALGPNLVRVVFDTNVVFAGEQGIQREVDRTRQLVLESLKAMRPVLLQSSGSGSASDPANQQRYLDAVAQVVSGEQLPQHLTALFIAGGQTAETVRAALGIAAVEIKGAFRDSIPWGLPLEEPFRRVPLVTKGGRMGERDVLFDFFEQGHPLPRSNVLPVVTPLTGGREIDEAGIEKLVGHLVDLGTTDIFAVGNAGEFRFLTNERRLQALEAFARSARGRLRVFAGVTGDSAEETLHNYQVASRFEVVAAVLMPLYFLKSSDEIVPFVQRLASISSGLPVVLYNNAERTRGENISFEAVEAVPFPVIAIKDSSGDVARLARYARTMPVYQGQQRQFLEGYLQGARGTVALIGHVSPLPNEFFAPSTTALLREEIARDINDLSKTVKQGGAEVAAYKYLLSLVGVMGDTVASSEPNRELTAAQREAIRAKNAELINMLVRQDGDSG